MVFFAVHLDSGTVEADSTWDSRVISYTSDWVRGSFLLIGKNRMLDGAVLYIE